MAYTPGPWVVRNHPDFGHMLAVIAPQYRKECDANHVVCELRAWRRPKPDADARIIAAAPELLAALKDCRDWLVAICDSNKLETTERGYLEAASNAIAKAEGRVA